MNDVAVLKFISTKY